MTTGEGPQASGEENQAGTCAECEAPLKAGAAFCTSCGASAPKGAVAPKGSTPFASAACAECGRILRPNAAFCTGCGRSTAVEAEAPEPASPTAPVSTTSSTASPPAPTPPPGPPSALLPPPPPSSAAAARPSDSARTSVAPVGSGEEVASAAASGGIQCGKCGTPLRPGAVKCSKCGGKAEAVPAITDDARQSGPKGSRTLLASVSGGTAGYGTRGSTGAATPPPAPSTTVLTPQERSRRKVIVGIAAAVLLLLACTGIVLAAQSSDDSGRVRASGNGSGNQDVHLIRRGSKGSSDTEDGGAGDTAAPGTAGTPAAPGSDPAVSTGAQPTPGTAGHGSTGGGAPTGPTHSGGGASGPAPGGGGGGGGGGGPVHTAPPVPPPPPPVLRLASAAVSVSGDHPSASIVIENAGGQNLSFRLGDSGIPGGFSYSPSSGVVRPNGRQVVSLTWRVAGTTEGRYTGHVNVSTNAGAQGVGVTADSRLADSIGQMGWDSNACRRDGRFHFRIDFRAQGGAKPAPMTAIRARSDSFPWLPGGVVRDLSHNVSANTGSFVIYSADAWGPYANVMSPRITADVGRGQRVYIHEEDAAGNVVEIPWAAC